MEINSPWVYLAMNRKVYTERLLLRPMSVTDLLDYYEYNSDQELLKYDYPPSSNLTESLEGLVTYNLKHPLGRFGIEHIQEKKLIGNISLRLNKNEDEVEIGYTINKNYNGKGYASEAACVLNELVEGMPKVCKFIGKVDSRNIPSIKILEKLGMKKVREEPEENLYGEEITQLVYEKELNNEDAS